MRIYVGALVVGAVVGGLVGWWMGKRPTGGVPFALPYRGGARR